jgi:hypothetical protein
MKNAQNNKETVIAKFIEKLSVKGYDFATYEDLLYYFMYLTGKSVEESMNYFKKSGIRNTHQVYVYIAQDIHKIQFSNLNK